MAKEAVGFRLLKKELTRDNRLIVHKSFQGARADFCVHFPGHEHSSLGIQLKTTGSDTIQHKNVYYQFMDMQGYDGLLVICITVHLEHPRIWMFSGSSLTQRKIHIPAVAKLKPKTDWPAHETCLADITDKLTQLLSGGETPYTFANTVFFEQPEDNSRGVEYRAFQTLRQLLPLVFTPPEVEHCVWNYMVEERKWQLKLAQYRPKDKCFRVDLRKCNGRVNKKRVSCQYSRTDFDFLCVQLPSDHFSLSTSMCYIVPVKTLADRGLVGMENKSTGSLSLYANRPAGFCHWTSQYTINLSNHDSAMADYRRVMAL